MCVTLQLGVVAEIPKLRVCYVARELATASFLVVTYVPLLTTLLLLVLLPIRIYLGVDEQQHLYVQR